MKKDDKDRIDFTPTCEEELQHLEKLTLLLSQKRYGDWNDVAKKLDVKAPAAEKAFLRVYSKRHFEAVEALELVIEDRKKRLIKK